MRRFTIFLGCCIGLGVLIYALYQTREHWLPQFSQETVAVDPESLPPPVDEPKVLKLSPEARKNLKLVSRRVTLGSYWRSIQIPGVIADRPGVTDRGVTSPAVGVVTKAYAFSGDTLRPGQKLFTIQLNSEYLQNTQSELFKAKREIALINEELTRLGGLAQGGAVAGKRLIELEQQKRRQEGLILAHRQGLRSRGLTPDQLRQIEQGQFISSIDVLVPNSDQDQPKQSAIQPVAFLDDPNQQELVFEVQELKVELGQQVKAGELLAILSNHRSLYIEGHAFKREAPLLENAAQNGWPVQVEFAEDDTEHWPTLLHEFRIRHLSNSIDLGSRTFDFFMPLTNQSRTYQNNGETFIVWRFRPGQRVRLHVPVEYLEQVIVLPSEAVVREGPEVYVFRQNGDLFSRISVELLHEDRTSVVLASGDNISKGMYLAQGSASSLNRVLKAQTASGMRADVHVHADGTVHSSH